MKLRRGLAAGAGIFSVVALGLALESGDPARAVAPPADGTYTFNQAGLSGVTWTISALCDQVNGSRYYKDYSNPDIMADFCALNVVSSTDEQISRQDKLQNYSGRARLVSGLWTFKVDKGRRRVLPERRHRGIDRNLRVRQRDARGHAHQFARSRLRPAAGDEQTAFLVAAQWPSAQPGRALPVAVQRPCDVLLSPVRQQAKAAQIGVM